MREYVKEKTSFGLKIQALSYKDFKKWFDNHFTGNSEVAYKSFGGKIPKKETPKAKGE